LNNLGVAINPIFPAEKRLHRQLQPEITMFRNLIGVAPHDKDFHRCFPQNAAGVLTNLAFNVKVIRRVRLWAFLADALQPKPAIESSAPGALARSDARDRTGKNKRAVWRKVHDWSKFGRPASQFNVGIMRGRRYESIS